MDAISEKFLRQATEDEKVIACSIERMENKDAILGAVYRLSGTIYMNNMLADLVMARRNRNKDEANRICATIMWDVEHEVLEQCRREAVAIRKGACTCK